MFFIFGSPRSGTTLLAQTLNAHPDIAIPHETDFIVPTAFLFDRFPDFELRRTILKQAIPHTRGFAGSLGEYLSVGEIQAIVDEHSQTAAGLISAIYAAVARKNRAMIGGDKSPNDLLFLRIMVKVRLVSSETRIVHIVRDVRDVLASLVRTKMTDDPISWFPTLWSSSNLYLNGLFAEADRYMLVRYEDMVSAPEATFSAICAHIGVPFNAQIMDPQRRNPRYQGLDAHRFLYRPIAPVGGDDRGLLSSDDLRRCEAQASKGLKAFGYEIH